ncbi:MAG: hypothetical protein NZO58_12055, partial [Gemmataceae bacterium]|nr:hypothetical protein [Gemmataceae bacterium]
YEGELVRLCWLSAPWLAWFRGDSSSTGDAADRTWLSLRDRWGLVWAQRVREQFNRAAVHAQWPVRLRWRGLLWEQPPTPSLLVAVDETLRALSSRFHTERR